MNKNRPTARRVSWTTIALNFFLELYQDIEELRIRKKEREKGYAAGTLADADIIYNNVSKKLGVVKTRLDVVREYSVIFWYVAIPANIGELPPPSDQLETAFGKVGEIYVKHQQTWNNAEEVELVDSEGESEEDGSDMDDEDL